MPEKLVALVVLATGVLLVLAAESSVVAGQVFKVEHRQEQQVVVAGGEDSRGAIQSAGDKKNELPKILDFANFKQIFRKHYSGWLEELVRCKFYLSRAMRTVLSAIRYQAGYDSHYLAINEMSDATLDERERRKNKQLEQFVKERYGEGGGRSSSAKSSPESQLPEFYLADPRPEAIVAELAKHSAEHVTDELKHLGETLAGRKKREVTSDEHAPKRRRRVLTQDQLFKMPSGDGADQLPPLTKKKVRAHVPSNNPNYGGEIEPMTMGLADQQERVNFINIDPTPTATFGNFLTQMSQEEAAAATAGPDSRKLMPEQVDLPDQIFTDLRHTNCFLTPRQQGGCGCCYAFSMIAIAEFLHCIKTGQLVAFSEQYMIDCGKGYIPALNGCTGAGPMEAGQFVHNFGMELRTNYPYMARENQCPYAPDVDLKTTGYIRTEIGNAVAINEQLWPEYLPHGPMWVGVILGNDFDEYAGGVHQPKCEPKHGYHAIVLIGHGREDGLEYWLFRNSYGVGWGEQGYYKMARSSPCIVTPGFMYGTADGRQYAMILEQNPANDGRHVGLNYLRNMVIDDQQASLAS